MARMRERPDKLKIFVLLVALFVAVPSAADQLALRTEGTVPAAAGESDLPWSSVVRELQLSLFDLGYYQGPIDGRPNSEMDEAIDRFQREQGAIGEGSDWPNMLVRIQAIGAAVQMKKALKRAREEQIKKARISLQTNAATRDLACEKKLAPANPARKPEACFANPTVRCLLDEALESIRGVNRAKFRNWALKELIRVEARLGLDRQARDNMCRMSDPRLVLLSMREIAVIMARAGRLDDASALAETIPDAGNRVRALAAIASIGAKAGDRVATRLATRRVLDLLEARPDSAERTDIAARMAVELEAAGEAELAREALAEARDHARSADPGRRDAALGHLATALSEMDDPEAAFEMIERIEGPGDRRSAMIAGSAALARAGKAQAALERATAVPDVRYRVLALCGVAVAQYRLGDKDISRRALVRAHDGAEKIESSYAADFARSRIAEAEAAVGNVEAAKESAEKIKNRALKARTLWRIAAARTEAGDLEVMASIESVAVLATREVKSTLERTNILSDVAIAFAAGGRSEEAWEMFDQAMAAAAKIRTRWWRARALARIAATLDTLGRIAKRR